MQHQDQSFIHVVCVCRSAYLQGRSFWLIPGKLSALLLFYVLGTLFILFQSLASWWTNWGLCILYIFFVIFKWIYYRAHPVDLDRLLSDFCSILTQTVVYPVHPPLQLYPPHLVLRRGVPELLVRPALTVVMSYWSVRRNHGGRELLLSCPQTLIVSYIRTIFLVIFWWRFKLQTLNSRFKKS